MSIKKFSVFLLFNLFSCSVVFSNQDIVINSFSPKQHILKFKLSKNQQIDNIYYGKNYKDSFVIENKYNTKYYTFDKRFLVFIRFQNASDTIQHIQLFTTELYIDEVGFGLPYQNTVLLKHPSGLISADKHFLNVQLLPHDTIVAYLIGRPFYFKNFPNSESLLFNVEYKYVNNVFGNKENMLYDILLTTENILMGILIVMLFFLGIVWFSSRDKIYGYYLLYVFSAFIYVLTRHEITFASYLHYYNLYFNCYVNEVAQIGMAVFFLQFFGNAFDIKNTNKWFYKLWQITNVISFIYFTIFTIGYFGELSFYNPHYVYLSFRIFLFIALLLFLLYGWTIKNLESFHKIILMGCVVFLLCNVFSRLQLHFLQFERFFTGMFVLYIGIAIEVIVFSMAFGIRVIDSFKQSEKLKDKLIIELQKNEEFIVNENQLLEAKVQERVEEINKQNILIDEQRHQTLLQNFEKEKAQIQMQALSSQMNPHFIFNCMNAIQHSILTNNTVKASSLLNDFALLIRMVLENSSQLKITLDDEIKLIDQYLKLEKNRLTEIFDYTIQIPSDVAVDFVKIPNMMLQPILENAIWHGFKNINYKGKLDVSFSVYDKLVTCEITDNGVGRKKSDTDTAVYKEQNSLAIEIIRKRMILINHTTSVSEASINFIDLTDDNNQPSGTKVILNLPIQ